MSRPTQISGTAPVYTRQAICEQVEGLVVVRCTVALDGTLQNCRVLKSIPSMDDAVLESLKTYRYTPARYKGRPIAIDYVLNIRLEGP